MVNIYLEGESTAHVCSTLFEVKGGEGDEDFFLPFNNLQSRPLQHPNGHSKYFHFFLFRYCGGF